MIADPHTKEVKWWGIHLVSLGMLVIGCCFLYWIFRSCGIPEFPTAACLILFASHPIKAQAVMWPAAILGYIFPFFASVLAISFFLKLSMADRFSLPLFILCALLCIFSVLTIEQILPLLIFSFLGCTLAMPKSMRSIASGGGLVILSTIAFLTSALGRGSVERINRFNTVSFSELPQHLTETTLQSADSLLISPFRLLFDPFFLSQVLDSLFSFQFAIIILLIAWFCMQHIGTNFSKNGGSILSLVAAMGIIIAPLTPLMLIKYYMPDRVFFYSAIGASLAIGVLAHISLKRLQLFFPRLAVLFIIGLIAGSWSLSQLIYSSQFQRYWEAEKKVIHAVSEHVKNFDSIEQIRLINFPRPFGPVPSFVNYYSFQGLVNWEADKTGPSAVATMSFLDGFTLTSREGDDAPILESKAGVINLLWARDDIHPIKRIELSGKPSGPEAIRGIRYPIENKQLKLPSIAVHAEDIIQIPSLDLGIVRLNISHNLTGSAKLHMAVHALNHAGKLTPYDQWITLENTAKSASTISVIIKDIETLKELIVFMPDVDNGGDRKSLKLDMDQWTTKTEKDRS